MTRLMVFGAGGRAGRQITQEAARRGIDTTGAVRDLARYTGSSDLSRSAAIVVADATNPWQVERAAKGHDAAIVATYAADLDPAEYGNVMSGLLHALERAGVRRLLLVGIATTLPDPAAPQRRVFEGPGFPAEWRPFSQARADELTVLERYAGPLDWVVFAPPMELVEDEGDRAYQIRSLGGPLSYTALANALLDEVVTERHHRVQVGLSGD